MTGQPHSEENRALFLQTLAAQLGIKAKELDLRLIEIPMTSSEFIAKTNMR